MVYGGVYYLNLYFYFIPRLNTDVFELSCNTIHTEGMAGLNQRRRFFFIKGPASLSLSLRLRCCVYDLNFHVKTHILKLLLQICQILVFMTFYTVSRLLLHVSQSCTRDVPSLSIFLSFLEIQAAVYSRDIGILIDLLFDK